MKIELTKWTIEEVNKFFAEKVEGAVINFDEMAIYGATTVKAKYCENEVPVECRENGEEDYIQFEILIGSTGQIHKSFVPDRQVCFIYLDVNEDIEICIEPIEQYVKREQGQLEFRLHEYNRYMA